MKVVAREYESNRTVRADCDEDWARVWRPRGEPRPVLLSCEEGPCHVRLCAVQQRRKSDGQLTRWFRFIGGVSCDHNEVDAPVVVPQRGVSSTTVDRPSGETAEHLWLKACVEQAALDSGYECVVQEQPLPRLRIVPDVTVADAVAGKRIEVQRGASDIPSRTEKDADVVWLLRLGENFGNNKHLFDWPCVSVRITSSEQAKTASKSGRLVTVKPWELGSAVTSFRVEAMGTVLHRRRDPNLASVYGFFRTRPMSLDKFLNHVWAGKRRWYPRHEVHWFGGWALESDVLAYRVWLEERRIVLAEQQAMAAREQARRTAAAPTADVRVDGESQLEPQEQPDVAAGPIRTHAEEEAAPSPGAPDPLCVPSEVEVPEVLWPTQRQPEGVASSAKETLWSRFKRLLGG